MTTNHPSNGKVQGTLFYRAESIPNVLNPPKVLVVYTGGTIGAKPVDEADPKSPLTIAKWDKLEAAVPLLGQLRRTISIDCIAFSEPLDSTNMQPEHWRTLVRVIDAYYADYCGFVILHGTDTIVYTASALSFMLEKLEKPVILTGSQLPIITHADSDGTQNFVRSILLAANSNIPEVCIFFDKVLLRGNRTVKVDAEGMDGFRSPNCEPLAVWADPVRYNVQQIRKRPTGFTPRTNVEPGIFPVTVFPGIRAELLSSQVDVDGVRGVILEGYGTGNAPTTPKFLEFVSHCTSQTDGRSPLPLLVVSQCQKGKVKLGQYETATALLERGAYSGSDITREAAMCKMMVCLGRKPADHRELRRLLETDLAGEQSQSIERVEYSTPATSQYIGDAFGVVGVTRIDLQHMGQGSIDTRKRRAS